MLTRGWEGYSVTVMLRDLGGLLGTKMMQLREGGVQT